MTGGPPVAPEPGRGGARERQSSVATRVADLVARDGELWHEVGTGEPYITIAVGGHREHHRLRSRHVREYLARLAHEHLGVALGGTATQAAVDVLAGRARYDGKPHPVAVRIATAADGSLVLDLGDPSWSAVVITRDGWRVVPTSPVRFRRTPAMRALPLPEPGGDLRALRALLPRLEEEAWLAIASWLVAALRPRGPYPVLVLAGEHGTGKSTVARRLRDLVDPAAPALRGVPRDEGDVMIGAASGHILALDNVSGLPDWLSDALCRVATGGGLAKRALYTDGDEFLLDVTRPILLTGISESATRGDLIDRCLTVTLGPLDDGARRAEAELEAAYAALRPRLFAGLLDAVAAALRDEATVHLPRLPRMADACRWVEAASPVLGWPRGAVATAWLAARDDALERQLAGDALAEAVRQLPLPYTGTNSDLLARLGQAVSETTRRGRGWPQTPRALSGALRRLAPALRRVGLRVEWWREAHTGRRLVEIAEAGQSGHRPSPPSPAPPPSADPSDFGHFSAAGSGDGPGDGVAPVASRPSPADSGLFYDAGDAGDGGDGRSRVCSTPAGG